MAKKLISTFLRHTTSQFSPENYVRPIPDAPRLSEVSQLEDFSLIDLSSTDRSFLLQNIHQDCSRLGVFQVINHGVSKQIIDEMVSVAHEFFSMSMEEKMKLYSDDPTRTTRSSTSFNVKKEEVDNWRDYFRLHCYPIDKYVHEWPSNPPSFNSLMASSSVRPTPTGPQVFINFRGKDVRNGFISFLEPAMREANINVFIDKDEVVGTDLVNLFVRIQESRVAVVIFSKGYTSSEWCLDELAQIKDCTDQGGLSVIPIFYKLATANVKELKGDFGDTFRALKRTYKHEPQRTQKWEEALESIPNIKGMALSEQSDRNEREFMNEMVLEIQRLLSQIAVKGNPKVESNSQGGFLVPARRLDITHSDNPEKWTWSVIFDRPHQADIEVATMINTHTLIKITGDIHTRKLIPGTKYEVVFLVRLDDTSLGWKKEVTLKLKVTNGDGTYNEQENALYLDEYIGENWVDIHVGEFEAPPKKENAKIFFSMHQYVDTDRKSGLVVKGFAIRPAE